MEIHTAKNGLEINILCEFSSSWKILTQSGIMMMKFDFRGSDGFQTLIIPPRIDL